MYVQVCLLQSAVRLVFEIKHGLEQRNGYSTITNNCYYMLYGIHRQKFEHILLKAN